VIPGAIKVNRGKMSIKDVAAKTLELNANVAIIVSVYRGNPGKIWFLHVTENSYQWIPPDILLAGVKLQREFGRIKIPTPHKLAIMVSKEAEEEQKKLAEALSKILESPLIYGSPNRKNNLTKYQTKGFDIILYIDHDPQFKAALKFIQTENTREIGPRIRIKKMFWQIKRVFET
jgi:rRNA maturation protein Rpf1